MGYDPVDPEQGRLVNIPIPAHDAKRELFFRATTFRLVAHVNYIGRISDEHCVKVWSERGPLHQFDHTAYPLRRNSSVRPFSTFSASSCVIGSMCWYRLGRRYRPYFFTMAEERSCPLAFRYPVLC